jgi:hypothetical protein
MKPKVIQMVIDVSDFDLITIEQIVRNAQSTMKECGFNGFVKTYYSEDA